MESKNSNRGSVIIVIVAILFILGGVFILNENFGQPRTDNTVQVARTEDTQPETPTPPSDTTAAEPDEDFMPSTPTTTVNEGDEGQTPSQDTTGNDTTTVVEDEESEEEEEPTNEASTNLGSNEIVMKVNSRNGTAYQVDITESGLENSKFFAAGATLNRLNINGVDLEPGSSYRVRIDVSETDNSFTINSLSVISEV